MGSVYLFSDQNGAKTLPDGRGAHTCMYTCMYTSPKPTLTVTSHLEQNALGLGIIAEQRNPKLSKFGCVSMQEILVVTWPYVHPSIRLFVRTTWKLMWDVLVSVGACKLILHQERMRSFSLDCTFTSWSTDSCQNRISTDQYLMIVLRGRVSIHRGYYFKVLSW